MDIPALAAAISSLPQRPRALNFHRLRHISKDLFAIGSLCLLTSTVGAQVINEAPEVTEVAAELSAQEAAALIDAASLRNMPITEGVDLDPLADQRIPEYRSEDFMPAQSDAALAQEPGPQADPLYTAPETALSGAAPLATKSAIEEWNATGQILSFIALLAGILTLAFARKRLGAPLNLLGEDDQPTAA